MINEAVVPNTPKTVVASYNRSNAKKIAEDEKKLRELEAARAGSVKVEEETPQEDPAPVAEAKPAEATKEKEVEEEVVDVPVLGRGKKKEEAPKEVAAEPDTSSEDWEKRYKDSQRYITEIKRENAQLKAAVSESKPPKTKEEIKAWMSKYPDVAGIMQGLVDEQLEAYKASTKEEFEQIRALREEATREKTEAAIIRAHPDYHDIVKTTKFHKWVEENISPTLQSALYERIDQPKEVSNILKLYKADTMPARVKDDDDDKELAKAARAVSPKGGSAEVEAAPGKKIWKESDIAAMNSREFSKNFAEIEDARAEGRIDYDLSKK